MTSFFTATTKTQIENLVAQGFDINKPFNNDNGHTPLTFACEHGKLEIAEALVDLGADMTEAGDVYTAPCQMTPIQLASAKGHLEIVKLLVKNKANTEGALWYAAADGHTEVIKYILSVERKLHLKTIPYGQDTTPLGIACYNGRSEIIEILINAGAKINSSDGPLILLAESSNVDDAVSKSIAEQLVSHGVDIHYYYGKYEQ